MCSCAVSCDQPAILQSAERGQASCGIGFHAGSTDSPVLRTLTPDSPPTASRTIAGRTLS